MLTSLSLTLAAGMAVLLWLSLPFYSTLLHTGGLVRPNFRSRAVPVAVGLLPALFAAFASAAWGSLGNDYGFITAVGVLFAALIGLLDDTVGNRETTGLRGHLGALLRGRPSTGSLKALAIPLAATLLSLALQRGAWTFIDAFIIALSANLVNLLDVRPGRAVKGCLLLLLLAALPGLGTPWSALWLLYVVALIVYAPWDLRARAMLGDSGANAFGFAAGWFCALALPPLGRLTLLAFLIGVHAVSERRSLSEYIENNVLLRTLDKLGT